MDYKEHFHTLVDDGKYEEALTYLEKFKGYAYEDAFYFANKGWLCNQFHDYENAKSCLLTGIRVFEQDGWMYAQLGCSYNRCMEYERALACFQNALALQFDEPWLHYEMALSYRELEQFSEALEAIENALLEEPQHCGYLEECGDLLISVGRFADAQAVYQKAYFISAEPYYRMMVGECLEKQQQYAKAIDVFQEIDCESLEMDRQLHLGICHFESRHLKKALVALRKARALGRDDTLLYRYLGKTQSALGKQKEAASSLHQALTYYQRALDLQEDRRWLYQEMLDIARILDEADTTRSILEQAFADYEKEAWIRYQLAKFYSDEQEYETSAAIVRDTDSSQYSEEFDYLLAYDLGRLDQMEPAVALLEALHKQHPDDIWVLCELGWNLVRLERYEAARDCFQKALSFHADSYCEGMLGWCLLNLQEYESAAFHLEQALAQGKREPWLYQALIDCWQKLNPQKAKQYEKALAELEQEAPA